MQKHETIDAYLEQFSGETLDRLQRLRQCIQQSAPDAVEAISYGIPTFKLNGALVHFGGFKSHISFFPSSSGVSAFATQLANYSTDKGTIRFPHDLPVPYQLVGRIVKFRVKEQLAKKTKKTKKK